MSRFFPKIPNSLLIILFLAFLLRLPSFFEPYWYGDEGIYLTLGMALRKGLVFYRDIHDNKPPLLYLLAALSGTQFWFRFILLWWNLFNVYLVYLFGKKIFKRNLPVLASSLLFLTLLLLIEGNIPNGEIFMIMPTTAAMLLIYSVNKITNYQLPITNYCFAGVLFSLAFLFKAPALFSFLTALIFLILSRVRPFLHPRGLSASATRPLRVAKRVGRGLWQAGEKSKGILSRVRPCSDARSDTFNSSNKVFFAPRSLHLGGENFFKVGPFQKTFILIFGFLLLPGFSFLYYWLQSALSQYITAAFSQNVNYLSSWSGGWSRSLLSLSLGFAQRSLALLGILVALYLLRERLSKEFLFTSLWFTLDLFGALLSGRPYPHYLIQAVPPLSLLLSILFFSKKGAEKLTGIFLVCFLCFTLFYYKFWRYPVGRYYANFFQLVSGQKTRQEYFSFFDSRVIQTYKLADLVKKVTKENDYIFVWGNEPYIYALADRLPPGRYTVAYHIIDFNGWEETIKAIKEKEPAIIVKIEGEKEFPELEGLLESRYYQIIQIEKAAVFKKYGFDQILGFSRKS